MATRIVVQQICDGCGYEGEQGSTATVRISAPSSESSNTTEYELDLCPGCVKNTVTPLIASGRPVKRTYKKGKKPAANAAANPADMDCGFPGCDYVGPRLQSLNAHRTKADHWTKKTTAKAKR